MRRRLSLILRALPLSVLLGDAAGAVALLVLGYELFFLAGVL